MTRWNGTIDSEFDSSTLVFCDNLLIRYQIATITGKSSNSNSAIGRRTPEHKVRPPTGCKSQPCSLIDSKLNDKTESIPSPSNCPTHSIMGTTTESTIWDRPEDSATLRAEVSELPTDNSDQGWLTGRLASSHRPTHNHPSRGYWDHLLSWPRRLPEEAGVDDLDPFEASAWLSNNNQILQDFNRIAVQRPLKVGKQYRRGEQNSNNKDDRKSNETTTKRRHTTCKAIYTDLIQQHSLLHRPKKNLRPRILPNDIFSPLPLETITGAASNKWRRRLCRPELLHIKIRASREQPQCWNVWRNWGGRSAGPICHVQSVWEHTCWWLSSVANPYTTVVVGGYNQVEPYRSRAKISLVCSHKL